MVYLFLRYLHLLQYFDCDYGPPSPFEARGHLDATFEQFVSFFSGVPRTGAIEGEADDEEHPGTDDSPPIYRSPIEQSAIRAAESLPSLGAAITQYNDKVDSRLSYLEDRLDRMEKEFIERLDKVAESVTNANDALAGSAYSLDTIRIRCLMDDARIAFRFAIVLSEEGISQSAAPTSIFQLCQDKFLEPLQQLKMWAEDLMEQIARENGDAKVLRHQGVDFMAMPEEKRRAELSLLFSQYDRTNAMVVFNTFCTAISILEDSDMFQLMEEYEGTSGAALPWGNPSAHPIDERHLTKASLSSGMLLLPYRIRQSLFKLWEAINGNLKLVGDRKQVPGGPFGQNDATALMSFVV
ncbi:hypothetical protein ACEPAI_1603 [Sanghuangporus weigelae]